MRDIFASNMAEYYSKIHEPDGKGACFLAVCRGKVIILFYTLFYNSSRQFRFRFLKAWIFLITMEEL